MKHTVIIAPGNGCNDIRRSNWYGILYNKLTERNVNCICQDFPDPLHARRDRWVPFIRSLAEKTNNPDDVVLIGHSAEEYPLHGAVLVSATYTDLGDAHERASGYYPQTNSDGKARMTLTQ